MYWNQVREGWPNEELRLFGPGTASGTYDYFAEAICGKVGIEETILYLKMTMF